MKSWITRLILAGVCQFTFVAATWGQATGRCCDAVSADCIDGLDLAECEALAGDWAGGVTCLEDPCADRPGNDVCEAAEELAVPGSAISDNSLATDDGMPACGTTSPGGGVWYMVVGTGNTMTASTCNWVTFQSDFDTKIQVFCDCERLTCIGGNDDDYECAGGEGLQSTVSWCSELGQPYYIHVGGIGAETGEFELTVSDDMTSCGTAIDCGLPECEVSTLKFEVKENELKWKVLNEGDTMLTIASITLEWPEIYGDLKEVKFAGTLFKDLAAPPIVTLTADDFLGKLEDRQVEPGKDEELTLKFTEKVQDLIDRDPAGFGIYVEFEEGCQIEWALGEYPDCVVSTERLDVGEDKIKWKIHNDGLLPLTIASVTVDWPAAYGDLKKIEFEGQIFEDFRSPPTTTITEFIGDFKNRQVKVGDKEELEIRFTGKVNDPLLRNPAAFYVQVEFEEGCSVEWIPGQEPEGEFACEKPVDELTLIWDGTEPVRVRAYKGSPGSELLADIDHIQVTDEITVSGFAGSPNDVYFEIFAAGTDFKLGESTFHLSCSDPNFDGPEDCGKRNGNGKRDGGGMINDWLLEGMVDAVGVLDCTP